MLADDPRGELTFSGDVRLAVALHAAIFGGVDEGVRQIRLINLSAVESAQEIEVRRVRVACEESVVGGNHLCFVRVLVDYFRSLANLSVNLRLPFAFK